MIFPLLKIGTLALRTLSKPVANRLKKTAVHHPKFRETISKLAQRRIYGHSTDVEIRPLDADKAVQAASEMLGEFFIFGVGGAVVIFEVSRNARSEARKEEARKRELENILSEIQSLKAKMDQLEQANKSRGWFSGMRPETAPPNGVA